MAGTLIVIGTGLALGAFASGVYAQVSVRDDTGYEVRLPAHARRIVTLAPHAAELAHAAGAGGRIVGTVSGASDPSLPRDLVVVGDVHALDLERIVSLKPDLIVSWPYTTPAQVAKLRERGLPVFITDPRTIDGIATNIERLGTLAGTPDAAAKSAAQFRAQIAQAIPPSIDRRVRVFYQIWNTPLFTIGADHLITQALTACGGDNVFASIAIPAPQVSVEAVIAARPEAIIAGTDGAKRPVWLEDWSKWPGLPAVRDRLLLVVDADRLHRPGPRFAEGVGQLCDAMARARTTKRPDR